MRLPADDSLVLPDDDDGAITVDSTSPAWDGTQDDLLGLIPGAFRGGTQIDRDAVLAMLGDISNEEWARFSHVLEAQESPRFADGEWLAWWGDMLGRRRQPNETDSAYRERLLNAPAVITPAAIKNAVDAIVAARTIDRVAYFEPAVDGAYCAPATTSDPVIAGSNNDPASPAYAAQSTHNVVPDWGAFAQPLAGGDTANQTVYVNQTKRLLAEYPGASNPEPPSYVMPETSGGQFWIVTPLDTANDRVPFCSSVDAAPASLDDWGFCSPVPAADWCGFTGQAGPSSTERIVSEVEHRVAAGTAYEVLVDPLIGKAV